MDTLIKFSKEGGFDSLCDVKQYFACEVPSRGNYINFNQKFSESNINTIYFTYESMLVAKAKFLSIVDNEQNSEYKYAFHIKDIVVFAEPEKIDNSLFQAQVINYIKTNEQKSYITNIIKKFWS